MAQSIIETIKWIFFRKKVDQNVVKKYKPDFQNILPKIEATLSNGNHFGQARVIATLRRFLDENKIEAFISELQSVNMWGGSGAVWEVYFENKGLEIEFYKEMLKLMDLMKLSGTECYGSNGVLIFFKQQLKS
jgi:hypothetical protein